MITITIIIIIIIIIIIVIVVVSVGPSAPCMAVRGGAEATPISSDAGGFLSVVVVV